MLNQAPKDYIKSAESDDAIYQISLPEFEGPLDLLYFLIKKNDVDILNIPIALITEQYLGHIEILQELNIDIAAEFLVLASELMYIKSKFLLPKEEVLEDGAEEIDPRADLVKRLLEYQKFKIAGAALNEKLVLGRNVFVASRQLEPVSAEFKMSDLTLFQLLEAFQKILKKNKIVMSHSVVLERLSVADRLYLLIERFQRESDLTLSQLVEALPTRYEIVITFLAVLEIAKLKLIHIYQNEDAEEIFMKASLDRLNEFSNTRMQLTEGMRSESFNEYQ